MTSYRNAHGEFAAPNESPRIAGVLRLPLRPPNSAVVGVWDLDDGARVAELVVPYGTGGSLANSVDGESVFSAAYDRTGVARTDVATGKEVWRRRDVSTVHALRTSGDGRRLFVHREKGSATVLDARTGEDAPGAVAGVKELWESPDGRWQLHWRGRKKRPVVTDGSRAFPIPVESFALLDVAFGADFVAYSAPNDGLRCVDLNDGALRWHLPNAPVARLAIDTREGSDTIVGQVHHQGFGKPRDMIHRVRAATGEVTVIERDWTNARSIVSHGTTIVSVREEEIALLDSRTGARLLALDAPPVFPKPPLNGDISTEEALANVKRRVRELRLPAALGERGE